MPSKKKSTVKAARSASSSAPRIPALPPARAGAKSRFSLSPIYLSTIGFYLLMYFGILANVSEPFRASLIANAGVDSLNANMWALVGILMIILALILYLAASQWYDKKAYYIPEKERASFREDLVLFGVAGLFILLCFLGCNSLKLIGVSANLVLPFIILASVFVTGGFLYVVYKNAESLSYLTDLNEVERLRLLDLVFDKPATTAVYQAVMPKSDIRKTMKIILPSVLFVAIALTCFSLLAGDPILKDISIYVLLVVALLYVLIDIFVVNG